MGCFNKKGCFSNMPITYGDRAVALLGIVDMRGDDNYSPGFHFTPISFPIRGTYNDYGSLENIDHVETNVVLEKRFKMNIEDIVDAFERFSMDCDSDKISKELKKYAKNLPCFYKSDRKYLQLSMIMEHEEIFDKLCNLHDWKEDLGKDFDADVDLWTKFVALKENNKDYISDMFKKIEDSIAAETDPDKIKEMQEAYDELKQNTVVQNDLKKYAILDEIDKLGIEKRRNYISFMHRDVYDISDSIWHDHYLNWQVLLDLYKNVQIIPEFRKEYVDFAGLYFAMHNLNLVFGVSNYYSQQVNYAECVSFAQCILDVMQKRKEKDDKERAEWEDE